MLQRCALLLVVCVPLASSIRRPVHQQKFKVQPSQLASHPNANPIRQKLTSEDGMIYYGVMEVGGQPQVSVYDTGSFYIVVASSCSEHENRHITGECCSKHMCPHATYSTLLSPAYHQNGSAPLGRIQYGSGPVRVRSGYDHVALKSDIGDEQEELSVRDMRVEVIVDHKVDLFKENTLQAIIGIAPGDQAKRQERVTWHMGIPRFTMCFHDDEKKDGVMIWNDKPRLQDKDWVTIPAPGVKYWSVASSDWKLRGKGGLSVDLGCQPSCGTVIDSGTTMITPPEEVALKLEKFIMNGNVLDCSDISKFPTFEFMLGDHQFSLPPQSYIARADESDVTAVLKSMPFLKVLPMKLESSAALKEQDMSEDSLKKHPSKPKKPSFDMDSCIFMMSPNEVGQDTQLGPMAIMGMSLFRKYAVQFDLQDEATSATAPPKRYLHLTESNEDCTGTAKGIRLGRTKAAEIRRVDIKKLRLSHLQRALLLQPGEKGGKLMQRPVMMI